MTALILDGRAVADRLRQELSARCAALVARTGAPPRLAVLRFDESDASAVYADSVARAARRVGIEPLVLTPAEDAPPAEISATIEGLNHDPQVAGVVIAQPLPAYLDGAALVDLVDPAKDVDGSTAVNAGRTARGEPAFAPATALAVMEILRSYELAVAGRRAVVVGRSPVVGRPVALLLVAADATVTICHRHTPDLARETRRAEILVVSAGAPGLIGAEMVRPGCVVVDCGITTRGDGVVGDVDFDEVSQVATAISPVPGGVGPVTSMMLAWQTVEAAELLAG
jgi:methylenetetrahydrofolate dehydrogenase (NADP+) / methenyltetrahydrofolate cyclohydrolase